jgi:cyclopropane-fatty-acyl-phospholipid synthase
MLIKKGVFVETFDSNAISRADPPATERPHRLETLLVSILSCVQQGRLTIRLPSGRTYVIGGDDPGGETTIHAMWNLLSYRGLRRILRSKSVGFAEGYIDGDWTTSDLTRIVEVMARNMDALEAKIAHWPVVRIFNRLQHLMRRNTKRGSRRNIAYHYDLGNDFYALWLDKSMTYSSAIFDNDHSNLDAAQLNKYRRLAEALHLQPHHRVLEIGCGWGGFAEFAAQTYGCHITCITLSKEQLAFARERIQSAGLEHLVELRLQDYRDVSEKYDRIVSIEMFEAVGEENWPTFFSQVRDCLADSGMAALQIINIADERFDEYRRDADFIQKYIFPGGLLPSSQMLDEQINAANLVVKSRVFFGASYARTLGLWCDAFLDNWPAIENLGYSKEFKRMWEYYLCYCKVGFQLGTIDVGHHILENQPTGRGFHASS